MNKTDLINTDPPAMLTLAKLALFGEIQTASGLHPGKVSKHLFGMASAQGKDPVEVADKLAEDLIPLVQEALDGKLIEAQAYLSKEYSVGVNVKKYTIKMPVAKYFNPSVGGILEFVCRRMREAGIDGKEMVDDQHNQGEVVMIHIRKLVHNMIHWSFHEAARIIMDREY